MSAERKEWLKVAHSANGRTVVTCSLMEGNLSVKWSVPAPLTAIESGVKQAKNGAERALGELRKAVENLEGEQS